MSLAKLNFIKLIPTNQNDLIHRDPRRVFYFSLPEAETVILFWTHEGRAHVMVA